MAKQNTGANSQENAILTEKQRRFTHKIIRSS